MMEMKIEFAKDYCLSTFRYTETIPIARTNPSREHYKTLFYVTLEFDPTWFMANVL